MPDALSARRLSRRGLLAAGGAAGAGRPACRLRRGRRPPSPPSNGGSWPLVVHRRPHARRSTRQARPSACGRLHRRRGGAGRLRSRHADRRRVRCDQACRRHGRPAGRRPRRRQGRADPRQRRGASSTSRSTRPCAPSCWSPTCTTRTPSGTCRTRARTRSCRSRRASAITTARVPMTKPIERYAELAESLGADLSAKKVTDAKVRFDAAAEAVRQAVKVNPGIKVHGLLRQPRPVLRLEPQGQHRPDVLRRAGRRHRRTRPSSKPATTSRP